MLHPSNIHRSNRKTLSLFIAPNGELMVKAPRKLPEHRIFDFVKSKERWIRKQQERILETNAMNHSVMSYNTFLLLGSQLTPVITEEAKKIQVSSSTVFTPHQQARNLLLIPAKYTQNKLSSYITNKTPDTVLKKVEKWLRDQAKHVAFERGNYFGHRLNMSGHTVTINNNKTRWGSCTRDGKLYLNWRVIMLRPDLVDYIVVHEFCHLLEFNHTKNFWALVETILPNWRDLRRELKSQNWILNLFRKA